MTDPPPDTVAALYVPTLLSIATVADLLGCKPRTVRRRIDAGLLHAVDEGGTMKVRADDLRAYIDGLERVGTTGRPRRHIARPRASDDFDYLRE